MTNLIWNIADDVLCDAFVRGKYRDVILPMTVIRRLDAVLESTKQAVLEMKSALDKAGFTNQDDFEAYLDGFSPKVQECAIARSRHRPRLHQRSVQNYSMHSR